MPLRIVSVVVIISSVLMGVYPIGFHGGIWLMTQSDQASIDYVVNSQRLSLGILGKIDINYILVVEYWGGTCLGS
jgi:hypothetical protein